MDPLRHRRRLRLYIPALAALMAGIAVGGATAQEPVLEPAAGSKAVAQAIAQVAAPGAEERPPIRQLSRPRPTRALIIAEQRATAARRAEAARLARSRTVQGALRRALLLRAIDQDEHDAMRRSWYRAGLAQERLGGRRAAELGAVLDQVRSLARRGMLGPGRIDAAILSVRRNAEVWTTRSIPSPGADVSFPRDDRVYRYIPGQGVQLHPLASFGVANALARRCISTKTTCRKVRLRRLLDDLVAVSVWRAGYRAWEYGYRFGTGSPPWVSGMAQGAAVQAFARGARALGSRAYLDIARSGLGAFERRPPHGVSTGTGDRRRYVMYSFAPTQHILNGELQAVAGIHDLVAFSGDGRARALYERGERGVRASVKAYDTGAWSLYSEGGAEANLHYHRFTTIQLRGLCRRTKQPAYCRAKHRFRKYQKEPPTVRIGAVRGAWAKRAQRIGFSVSKVGRVWVRVDGPGGRSFEKAMRVSRGRYSVTWVPPRRGTYTVRIDARGLSGPAGRTALRVNVLYPKPKPKPKPSKRRTGARKKAS
ncbi:D-glucuronyl C5-epimerase family protein [Svornostia abyssi]|uniref:D-glucuronyl C5-epimerase family protein n=1 Tax=Svornostia abyssi TaxID=2898438 RepID=A0ABY5PBK6_9ACTN|nr:D-glucuronyl C5-epimerase family protein [Parviterribacteraceae bacterium J379]